MSNVGQLKVTTVKPDSVLYFDPGSSFPRYKLGLTANKRCIKPTKADVIVVSGNTNRSVSDEEYTCIECTDGVYFVEKEMWEKFYSGKLDNFLKAIANYKPLNDPKVVYSGKFAGYTKESVYIAKYIENEYTLNYITDIDLDKIINNMCPEPTYEELVSIIDMLNSEDAATVQLGVKMIQGYNASKYKMTLRLILCTRSNWFLFTKNTVGTKQLMETLEIDRYRVTDNFISGCRYVCNSGESYTAEDIAISKKLSKKLLTEYFQKQYQDYFINQNFKWLPDERKIELK